MADEERPEPKMKKEEVAEEEEEEVVEEVVEEISEEGEETNAVLLDDNNGREEPENLRELILEQLANLEQSDVSEDGSYQVRLSCILEDDESESSGAQSKDGKKPGERNKESEKGPPDGDDGVDIDDKKKYRLSGGTYDSETSDEPELFRIADLEDGSLREKDRLEVSEESDEFAEKPEAYSIKKLKSSDNLHKRPFVTRRRELSSDSSDLDISVTNSASSEVKITEVTPARKGEEEEDDEKTLNAVPEIEDSRKAQDAGVDISAKAEGNEPETRLEQEIEPEKRKEIEVIDNETLSAIFARVSKTYLEKTKKPVKWEETERVDRPITPAGERSRSRERPEDHLSLQDAYIRGTTSKEYNPPVPPETYLWEELKRLRERGGYPWTYLDKPPFDEATWKKYMEHVYEPINPPPSPLPETHALREEDVANAAGTFKSKSSSIPEAGSRSSLITPETEYLKKRKEDEEEVDAQEIVESEMTASIREVHFKPETQHPEEDISVSAKGSTTIQTKSSPSATLKAGIRASAGKLFKGVPTTKHPTLAKTRREQMRTQAREIQDKLRDQAGRIRTKFNTMQSSAVRRRREGAEKSAPKFKLPEIHAPKISFPDRSKFKLPETAKFHFPEKAKFHLPEKIHLPEKAKLHLPERPKLHLPDPSKLRLPERPKLHLPERAKFHLPQRPRLHLPERPKLHLPDRAKFHLSDKAKLRLPDRPKFHLPDAPRFTLPETAKMIRSKVEIPRLKKFREPHTPLVTTMTESGLKSYPKLFWKHAKDYTTSSPKPARVQTPPPPRMLKTKTIVQQQPSTSDGQWNQKHDEDIESGIMMRDNFESILDYHEKDGHFAEDSEEESKRAMMADRLADNVQECQKARKKKGVLEEINSDEYFLRQKGISQDDIEMSHYLSKEIREAFRSPGANALLKMDYADDENLDPEYRVAPTRPMRTSTKNKKKMKSILKKTYASDPALSEDKYKTYPPRRPGRKSRSQSKSLLNEDAVITETLAQDERQYENYNDGEDANLSRYDNVDYDEDEISEYYKSPKPFKEYEHYKVPRLYGKTTPSPPRKRKPSLENESLNEFFSGVGRNDYEIEPPVPATRTKKKKKKKETGEFSAEPRNEQISQEIKIDFDEDVLRYEKTTESPIPPKRTRSLGSRSFVTEEEISCSFQSELEKDCLEVELGMIAKSGLENSFDQGEPGFVPMGSKRSEITDLDDAAFGYATVGKPTVTKPPRLKKKVKPERPPPPRRKKEVSVPIYNTYPRRAPARPSRNYSTLGPSRPPRRSRMASKTSSLAATPSPFRTYSEIQDGSLHGSSILLEVPGSLQDSVDSTEVSASSKDLQTYKVIEKMKGRPLPPPPRPPRQKSKGPEDFEPTEEEEISLSILRDDEFPLAKHIATLLQESPNEIKPIEEIRPVTPTNAPTEDSPEAEEDRTKVIQEFSQEQLRIQQMFLEEMKKEEEELRRKGLENDADLEEARLKAEVIRQIEDIIEEEKRILENGKSRDLEGAQAPPDDFAAISENDGDRIDAGKTERKTSSADPDMGYASLERKVYRQESPVEEEIPPELPPKLGKLRVRELEADMINVREVQSDLIFVKELQSNRISSEEIDNRGGNTILGNIDLPPAVIDQIVAKIPWDSIRSQSQPPGTPEPGRLYPPVRPKRRPRRTSPPPEDSDEDHDDGDEGRRRSHFRRPHRTRCSSDEEDEPAKTSVRVLAREENIGELSVRLAKAVTSAGMDAVRSFVQTNASFARSLDREMCVQAILCIAITLVAAFFLFGYDAKIVHLNRWDFQFPPPEPPNPGTS